MDIVKPQISGLNWWEPNLTGLKFDKLQEVLDSNFLNDGVICRELEEKITNKFKVSHCITTPSATAALTLGALALNLKYKKVAISNITFAATANAFLMAGCEIVIIDAENNSGIMDTNSLNTAIREGISALVVTHVSGRDCLSKEVIKICEENEILIIEDSAEALGFHDKNFNFLGTRGIFGVYSFSPNKIITSGQGGVLVTNDDQLYEKASALKNQGRIGLSTGGGEDNHDIVGWNFKFTDVQAAIIHPQFDEIDWRVQKLTKIMKLYGQLTNRYISFNLAGIEDTMFALWPEIKSNRIANLSEYLIFKNVPYRKMWKPLTSNKAFSKYRNQTNHTGSENFSSSTIWLTSNLNLPYNDFTNFVKVLEDFIFE